MHFEPGLFEQCDRSVYSDRIEDRDEIAVSFSVDVTMPEKFHSFRRGVLRMIGMCDSKLDHDLTIPA
jgi:hypothetical protein